MRFHFIHAADLHIDSPLASLGAKDPAIAALFARANRGAAEALVRETIASGAKFLVVAGDVFDREWKDVSTGLFFVRQLGELHRAGVPTFLIKGNHDAESVVARNLPYPDSVHVFDAREAQTRVIEGLRVALHGRSFPDRAAPPNFLSGYPARREGWLNIGLLHTGLDGGRGEHAPYAPCTASDLAGFGYDYWALGHIHTAEIVSRRPWIVFPGNIQGRNPRETGPKGAMRVTVEDGRIVAVDPLPLDVARWAHQQVDMSGVADEAAARARMMDATAQAMSEADGRPLALRLTLTGETPMHVRLVANREALEDDARARAFEVAAVCWVERLRVATRAPTASQERAAEDGLDIDALVAAAAEDPEFVDVVAEIVAEVAKKLPRDLLGQWESGDPGGRARLARDFLAGARS